MKATLWKAASLMAALCAAVCLGSCKDDDESIVSVNTIVGVWEGIDADYWTTDPNAPKDDNWWLTETEKDEEEYGEDISDYRVEFTSDGFYRVYRYNTYSDQWDSAGSNGMWKIEGNALQLMAYNSSEDEYDEDTPEVYQVLEMDGTRIVLEYHKKTSAGETYRKLTFRQIASKEDMADEQKGEEGNADQGAVIASKELLIGNWEYTAYYEGETENGELVVERVPGVEGMDIFLEDGTYIYREAAGEYPDGWWKLSGNRLTINDGEDTEVWTITELTETRLVYESHTEDAGVEYYERVECRRVSSANAQ